MFLLMGSQAGAMDPLHNKQDFDPYKYRQKYHHSLKEHQIFSKIPKFRCEML